MKNLLLIFLSALSLTAMAQQKTVAVLDPICRDNSVNAFYKQMVRGAMESAVTASEEYEAYDRSAFDQIQKEQAFQRTGAVSDSQIKKMGEMAGVDYVLVSEVSAYEGYMSSVVKILNVTTGKYDKSVDDYAQLNPESVKTKCREMASSLFGNLNQTSGRKKGQKEQLIYAQSNEDNQYCDGNYSHPKDYFSVDLDNLNRKHFRIVFSFMALEFTNADERWKDSQYPLVLSEGWRVLGICLKDNGKIYIETDNGENEYGTGLSYFPRQFKELDLEYDKGELTINGIKLNVKMNEYNGDNTLTSIEYGKGLAFLGYIHSLRVYNILD